MNLFKDSTKKGLNGLSEQWLIILSFGVVYFVWGSTFLANEYAIDYIPPRLMLGARFMIAGLLLLPFTKSIDWRSITKKQFLNIYIIGVLFLTFGAGSTVVGQVYLDSGITCLICGTNPLMVVLIIWALNREKLNSKTAVGVLIGIIGLIVLIFQDGFISSGNSLFGIGIVLFAVFSWSVGTVFISKLDLPKSKSLVTGIQMLTGGANLLIIGLLTEDTTGLEFENVPFITWAAMGYLILFGSLIAFSAFNYLLKKVSPSKVATSAYVNPIIAVFLGWFFRNEVITHQTLIAAVLLILAVVFINSAKVSNQETDTLD